MATRRPITRVRPGRLRPRSVIPMAAGAVLLSGCSLLATPNPPSVRDASLAPSGPVGYVVCPSAVTPVELHTGTPEATIGLPLSRPASLGNFAIATSPDGRWAYVVTTIGGTPAPSPAASPASSAASATAPPTAPSQSQPTAPGAGQSEVVPVDLVAQRAGRPIPIPSLGGTHAIIVLPDGHTVLAGDGTAIVPVDAVTRRVGAPVQLGPGHTVYGMALAPSGATVYTLVPGGVIPVNTATSTTGADIPTGLAISSVYSPHGVAVSADGSTVYVVGQGGTDFGGRVLPIVSATGATLPPAVFDRYGIADPAALALVQGGVSMLAVDSANNWVNPVAPATFAAPPQPIRLPQLSGPPSASGTDHPTDVVLAPDGSEAFIVDGFASVIPYLPATQTFGRPIAVCSGASSMAVAPAP
jgi:hypothetical protein